MGFILTLVKPNPTKPTFRLGLTLFRLGLIMINPNLTKPALGLVRLLLSFNELLNTFYYVLLLDHLLRACNPASHNKTIVILFLCSSCFICWFVRVS